MARILAYTPPALGHVFPLVPGLQELQRRGHDIHVRTAPDAVAHLRAAGLSADAVDERILEVEVTDFRAANDAERLRSGQRDLVDRGRFDGPDLDRTIERLRPDVLLVDCMAYGAQVRAQVSGLPWAMTLPSLLPLRERGIPPYGLGLAPRTGVTGAVRDALIWPVVVKMFGKAMLPGINELRRAAGLPVLASPLDLYDQPDAVICMTGVPLEYHRSQLPASVQMVGFQPWDPPAAAPDFIDEPGEPWILVTCSTEYQGDESLARTAVEALRDQPFRVLLTLADAYEKADLPDAPNITKVKFVPHGPIMDKLAAVVTHAGMGIVGKATRAGVPIVAVPFGRDQPEIARRITEAGVGVSIPAKKLTAAKLREAVHGAVAMRPRAQAVARDLEQTDPARACADAVGVLVSSPNTAC
ncbi:MULTISPECIES: glycosyltransferase [Actinomycetes]|uniref:glycosyltransferase n=1 Tax=Actinomycetes TaxID=1760 RepID=UPI0004C12D53|nr:MULTISPECIES: glycosyltransferase [Actinomycetes]